MNTRRHRIWLVACLGAAWATGLLSGAAASGADDERDLERRFRREIPAAIEAMERGVKNVACRGHRSDHYGNFEADVNLFVRDGSRLEQRIYQPGSQTSAERGAALVRCLTDDSVFRLEQESRSGPYAMVYHSSNPVEIQRFTSHLVVHLENFVFASHYLLDLALSRLVSEPSFRIQGVRRFEEDGEERVEIAFDLAGSDLWYDSGRMVLCPGLGWSVRRYELRYQTPDGKPCIDRGDVRCRRWPGGHIFPESVRIERECPVGGEWGAAVDEVEFTAVEWGKVSPERFTLASFGIRTDPAPEPIPVMYYLLALSALCGLGAVVFRVLRRRSERSAASA